jgi:hypothetical protein
VYDKDERPIHLAPASNVRQICAEIYCMLLNGVVRDDPERPFAYDVGIVAPGGYSCIRYAMFSIRKQVLRPETCVFLSYVSSPRILAVASQAMNEDNAAMLSARGRKEGIMQLLLDDCICRIMESPKAILSFRRVGLECKSKI